MKISSLFLIFCAFIPFIVTQGYVGGNLFSADNPCQGTSRGRYFQRLETCLRNDDGSTNSVIAECEGDNDDQVRFDNYTDASGRCNSFDTSVSLSENSCGSRIPGPQDSFQFNIPECDISLPAVDDNVVVFETFQDADCTGIVNSRLISSTSCAQTFGGTSTLFTCSNGVATLQIFSDTNCQNMVSSQNVNAGTCMVNSVQVLCGAEEISKGNILEIMSPLALFFIFIYFF